VTVKTILATVCLLVSAFGQTIRITDGSPSDSPLKFKGTITFGAEVTCEVTGHNDGSRTIVAWVAQLHVIRPDGQTFSEPFTNDHFFKNDQIIAMMSPKPGLDFDIQLSCSAYHHKNYVATPQSPSMTITGKLVQFDDGSVWGEAPAAKELAFQRQDAVAYLQSLKAAGDLTKALVQEPAYSNERGSDNHVRWETLITWKHLSEDPTPEAKSADLDNRLSIAEAHKAWLERLATGQ
jgi:hypothetical protein